MLDFWMGGWQLCSWFEIRLVSFIHQSRVAVDLFRQEPCKFTCFDNLIHFITVEFIFDFIFSVSVTNL